MILNPSTSSSHFWFSMYSIIVFSSTAPTVAQKYPRAHRCCPQYRLRKCGNSSCNRREDFPFTYCTNFAGDNCGGAATVRARDPARSLPG